MRLVQLLEIFDPTCDIDLLQEKIGKGTPDADWIAAVGRMRPKPTILGGDGRILKRPPQLSALKDAGLNFVYFTEMFSNLKWHDLAIKGLQVWPRICEAVGKAREPTVFRVHIKSLKVELVRKLADFPCREEKTKKGGRQARSQSA